VNPDDQRNFRIKLYAFCTPVKVKMSGEYDPNEFSDEEVLADFNVRQDARLDHPAHCAEEYECIINLFIKHLFN
jgi:hypothetical protein